MLRWLLDHDAGAAETEARNRGTVRVFGRALVACYVELLLYSNYPEPTELEPRDCHRMSRNLSPDVSECPELLKTVFVIRYSEGQLGEDLAADKLPDGVHLSVGHEAVLAGTCAHLPDRNSLSSTHRGTRRFLAKCGEPRHLLAEKFGKVEGACRGMGSSLHVADPSTGIIGASGAVGVEIPIAAGMAPVGMTICDQFDAGDAKQLIATADRVNVNPEIGQVATLNATRSGIYREGDMKPEA